MGRLRWAGGAVMVFGALGAPATQAATVSTTNFTGELFAYGSGRDVILGDCGRGDDEVVADPADDLEGCERVCR